jgi:hypothetical protein
VDFVEDVFDRRHLWQRKVPAVLACKSAFLIRPEICCVPIDRAFTRSSLLSK